jgi:hypothetical protein
LHGHVPPLREILARGLDPFDADLIVTACDYQHGQLTEQERKLEQQQNSHAAAMARAKARATA